MKARDTVMTGKQVDSEMDRIEKLDTSYTTAELELCKAQAEISFKAGIREVVEWINSLPRTHGAEYVFEKYGSPPDIHPTFKPRIFTNEWQAKLKEWGID